MSDRKFFGIITVGLIVTLTFAGLSLSIEQENKTNPSGKTGGKNKTLENQVAEQGGIKKFQDRQEIKKFLQENETVSSGYMKRQTRRMPTMEGDAIPSGEAAMDAAQGSSRPQKSAERDHSKTNIQVEGVDEADIIKNDGEYIYVVSGKNLFIIKSYPAQDSEVVSRIKFDSQPRNIYLNQDKLAVFGSNNNFYEKEKFPNIKKRNDFTFFKVFDISDRSQPEQVRDLNFEGNYFDSRMVGDHVYFITSNPRYHYMEDAPALPRILEEEKVITDDDCGGNNCLDPEVYRFDIPYDSYNFTNVAAINIQNSEEKINSEMYLFSGNQNMYVSPNNIYITYTKRINPRKIMTEVALEVARSMLDPEEKKKIKNIQEVEDYILTEEEKWGKIENIMDKHFTQLPKKEKEQQQQQLKEKIKEKWKEIRKEMEKTVIHKIAINGRNLEYQTQGEVTGHVLNQFSMSEQGDHFRIATTKGRDWGRMPVDSENRESYSNIYVLDQDLEVVGSVEELAPGERIYSARFMQNRGYLVTFKQMDPLFVVDLEDPRNPEVLGKLKIPGFSNYLHPYNEDTLIGIGKETEAQGEFGVDEKGLKISLFDVSDVNDPQQVDIQVLGQEGSNSPALNNHKAVLFDREKNLLSIPVRLRTEATSSETTQGSEATQESVEPSTSETPAPPIIKRRTNYNYFRGAAVLNVNEEELELRGKIQHDDGKDRADQIKRSLYIENTLYTVSDNYLKMNDLENLDTIKELELKKENDYQIIN